jgi:hypothetical protein
MFGLAGAGDVQDANVVLEESANSALIVLRDTSSQVNPFISKSEFIYRIKNYIRKSRTLSDTAFRSTYDQANFLVARAGSAAQTIPAKESATRAAMIEDRTFSIVFLLGLVSW